MTKRDKDIDPNSPAVIREGQMQLLAEIGGKLLGEEDITFSGTKFVLPAKLDLDQSIEFLEQRRNDEETVNRFVKEFNYRPLDGARATAQAIKEAFGFTLGKTLYSFFGNTPPTFIDVRFGPGRDDTEQVPWGAMQIPGFANTTVYLGNSSHPELGLIFQIRVEGPRKYRWHFEGLFRLIERNLRENSIYRGKAIDGAESPNFLDTTSINPDDVVYTREVLAQLEANVWSPIKHADVLDKLGQPGKRTVLFEGPYGTGKSLAALLTAQVAEKNGWTFLLCRPGKDDLNVTMQTARMYQPAVVFFEDLDTVARPGTGDDVSQILDMFDGITTKGLHMLLVLTTNHAERIHKGMVRPGRLDAVIHVGEMDRDGVETLTRRVIGDSLEPDIDFDKVFRAMDGYMPAFVKEALDRAIRYSVSRNNGTVGMIDTDALVLAASGLRDQFNLMTNASDVETEPTLDRVFARAIGKAAETVLHDTAVADLDDGYQRWQLVKREEQ